MDSIARRARTAGLLYLVVWLTGSFSLLYVPSRTIVDGDASATVGRIVATLSLFRLGIAVELVGFAVFLMLPLALYALLSRVSRSAATLMVAFAVVSVPIAFVNVGHKLDIASVLGGGRHLPALATDQVQAQVLLSLDAYGNGILVSELFWGLWLLPLGYLVFKSGFLPRVLGILLMIGCFSYLIDFFGLTLSPAYVGAGFAHLVRLPAAIGELALCLWLLIVGAREPARRP